MRTEEIVTLSDVELWKLERVAKWRNEPKVGTPTDGTWPGHDGYAADRLGVFGEYAVSVYYREPMDLFIDLGGDNNVADLIIANMTVAVKCTKTRSDPHLIFKTLEEFRQDVAVLTTFEEPNRVRLHGWTYPDHFKRHCFHRDYNAGDRVAIASSKLFHPVTLKAIAFDRWRSGQLGGQLMRSA